MARARTRATLAWLPLRLRGRRVARAPMSPRSLLGSLEHDHPWLLAVRGEDVPAALELTRSVSAAALQGCHRTQRSPSVMTAQGPQAPIAQLERTPLRPRSFCWTRTGTAGARLEDDVPTVDRRRTWALVGHRACAGTAGVEASPRATLRSAGSRRMLRRDRNVTPSSRQIAALRRQGPICYIERFRPAAAALEEPVPQIERVC